MARSFINILSYFTYFCLLKSGILAAQFTEKADKAGKQRIQSTDKTLDSIA